MGVVFLMKPKGDNMIFKKQQDCWHFVANGATLYLDDIPIKFIDGVLKAKREGVWTVCPISFENPTLFKANI